MPKFDFYTIFYDVIAYLVAFRSLIDEILYKFGYKRRIDVRKDLPSCLTGRVAIVTGGTRGLGLTVVKTLLSKGCSVFVASSQTTNRFNQILETIYDGLPEEDPETGVPRGSAYLHQLDLSSMKSVLDFVKAFKKSGLGLNYLICNAGIMFAPRQLTEDCFESHLAINYLGHFLLIVELLPYMKKTADRTKTNSRIVNVSSSTHHITKFKFEDILSEANYSSSQAYGQSKLAQIMFSAKLARVLRDKLLWTNIQTFSLHPGVVLSDLYEHVHLIKYFPFLVPIIRLVTRVSINKFVEAFEGLCPSLSSNYSPHDQQDMVQGAETTLYATLSEELHDVSGVYLEDCAIKEPSSRARMVDEQDRLWDLSKSLLSPSISTEAAKIIESY